MDRFDVADDARLPDEELSDEATECRLLSLNESHLSWTHAYRYDGRLRKIEVEFDADHQVAPQVQAGLKMAVLFVRSRNRSRCRTPMFTELKILIDRILAGFGTALRDCTPAVDDASPRALAQRYRIPAGRVQSLVKAFQRFRNDSGASAVAARDRFLRSDLLVAHRAKSPKTL